MSDTQIINENLTGIATINPMPGAFASKSQGSLAYAAPVYVVSSGVVGNARANAAGTALVVGLSLRECDAAGADTYVTPNNGPVDFPTSQWDAVTGQTGGLTPGVPYYLSAATAGKLTTTAPSGGGDTIVLIGIARDPTTMILGINYASAPLPIIID